ncbi:MAG: hypothetical protein LAT51_01225 [Flavobacteriaceae bacterium]|nr:hypothetical protein [Flavobacteriaceae bacterium]
MKKFKKFTVLAVLFILPLVAYLFFSSGVNNFGRLPVLEENVLVLYTATDPITNNEVQLQDKINILTFLGGDVSAKSVFAFNLKEKIYDKNREFNDFQVISFILENQVEEAKKFIDEINKTSDAFAWKIIVLTEDELKKQYAVLNSKHQLDDQVSSAEAFIIDKKGNLRGRLDDEDEGVKKSYNTKSVAELNNKMVDDIKVILAEYRLELKKYTKEALE